ncbi:MAG: tetratricopeptide repeat protein [Oscillospiraceae bacterium]|nr:tetratricopeptide repeat protein [Oscillospiraceae bacterium]
MLGETHPDTLDSLHNLAFSYYESGDYPKAMEFITQLYESRKEVLGDNHPDTLTAKELLTGILTLMKADSPE